MKKNIPDCFYRTSMKALILDDEKRFLLTREINGWWELPGGGLDFGEKPHVGLKREIKEEMNIEVIFIEDRPAYFTTSYSIKRGVWFVNVIYLTKVKNLDFTSSNECVEVRFFIKEETLKVDVFPNVKEFIRIYDPKNH